jgi:hypothetical protein
MLKRESEAAYECSNCKTRNKVEAPAIIEFKHEQQAISFLTAEAKAVLVKKFQKFKAK